MLPRYRMATEIEKHTSFPGGIDPDALVAQTDAAVAEGQTVEVRARGYWESVWLRLRKDKLALAGAGFIVFLFFVAFAGAPIASHFLGHGPNVPFFSNGGVTTGLQPARALAPGHVVSASGRAGAP